MIQQVAHTNEREHLLPLFIGGYMRTLENMLQESGEGSRKDQEIFACQFNKISNMLYRDYGVRSVHMVFIIRDILIRMSRGECILEEDKT